MKDAIRRTGLIFAFAALSLCFTRDGLAQTEIYDYERMASAIVNMLNAATDYIADNFEVINTNNARVGEPLPKGELHSYKGINPEGFAGLVGKQFAKLTGISVKFVSNDTPRSSQNKADKWESKQLKKFSRIKYPKGVGYGEVVMVNGKEQYDIAYRYIYPLYIEHKCLKCHGDPARSPTGDGRDITGFEMEDFKEGELSGAISLVFPIE
ncbi:MAG: Tll0287-like domain-containing protein [Candidatus Bathyanammoxibius sp.]